jgi:hypothetical protein
MVLLMVCLGLRQSRAGKGEESGCERKHLHGVSPVS